MKRKAQAEARQRRRLWQVQSRWMGRDGMGRCCDALPQVDVQVVEDTVRVGTKPTNGQTCRQG